MPSPQQLVQQGSPQPNPAAMPVPQPPMQSQPQGAPQTPAPPSNPQGMQGQPSYLQLGQMIQQKYPQYANMDANQVGMLMAQKYPSYSGWTDGNIPQSMQPAPSVGGFIGNAINSAGKFIGGIGNAIMHPIQTVKNLGGAAIGGVETGLNAIGGSGSVPIQNQYTDDWNNIVGYYQQKYGSPSKFLNTLYTDPVSVAADASALLTGVGAGVGALGEAGEAGAAADAVNAGDVLAMGGKTAEGASVATPAISGLTKAGEAIQGAGEAINPLNAVTKPISAIAGSDFLSGAAKGGFSQATGIQPNDIDTIMKYPDEFTADAVKNYNRADNAETIGNALDARQESLTEAGKGYADIRSSDAQIPVTSDYLKNLIASKTGLTVEGDGTGEYPYELKVNGDSSIKTQTDATKLQRNILDKWSPEFAKGYLTPNQFLNLRGDLADMAKFEGGIGKSAPLDNLAGVMRGQLNTDFRSQIPGLAEKDADFAQQSSDLRNLRAGLLNKNNELLPSATNKIANSLGKGKDAFLSQLEELSPGITKDIAVGKAMENLQALKGNVVGTYGRTTTMLGAAGGGLAVGGPIGAIEGALADQFLTNPTAAMTILKGLGKASPIYQAVLEHFNVASPGLILGQLGKMSKATQTPTKRQINIRLK